jgi:hypothetical protein
MQMSSKRQRRLARSVGTPSATQRQSIQEFIASADVDDATTKEKHIRLINSAVFLRDAAAKAHFFLIMLTKDLTQI